MDSDGLKEAQVHCNR